MLHEKRPLVKSVSRRTILKGAVVSMGAFTLGTRVVTADQEIVGGSLLIVVGSDRVVPDIGDRFTLTAGNFEFSIPASCQADESELKNYDIFSVTYQDGSEPTLAAINRGETNFDGSGETVYEFTKIQGCNEPDIPGVYRGSFKPV